MNCCELCERELVLTEHHLIPREMHNKKWCQKMFSSEERKQRKALVCQDCHAAIHTFIENKELAKEYNTVDKLLRHDKLLSFVNWVKKSDTRKFKF